MLKMSEREFVDSHASFNESYESVRQSLLTMLSEVELVSGVGEWVRRSDKHFPRAFQRKSLAELLSLTLYQICSSKGVGLCRAKVILKVLKAIPNRRNSNSRHLPLPIPNSTPEVRAPDVWWSDACKAIYQHRMEQEPFGRFCASLSEVPKSLWDEPLDAFARFGYEELQFQPRIGSARLRLLTTVFGDLYQLLRSVPPHEFLSLRFTQTTIMDVKRWIWVALRSEELPSLDQLRQSFVAPLMTQVAKDGGDDLKSLAAKRVLEAQTLEEIASECGLTRERIRQRLCEVGAIMRVRWSEGQYLLDDLLDKVSESADGKAQATLVQNTFQLLFPIRRHSLYRHIVEELETMASSGSRFDTADGSGSTSRQTGHSTIPEQGPRTYINEAILDLLAGASGGSK